MVRGQSALEYMMTYGWAILIIVIVAVILYSMGIFNPRASVTASSNGFSPFAPSAAVCGSSNLTVAFTTGALPQGASSATLINESFSSATGMNRTSASVATAVTVSSGTSFRIVFPATCTSGVGFSANGAIYYSVATSAGPATYKATGTIAGTGS